jgi:hypothetical protein
LARLPKSLIKKHGISKKAWSIFKRRRKSPSRTRKASPSRRRGGRKTMARRKKRRGGKSITNTVFKWIRVGALVGPGVGQALRWKDAGPETMVDQVLRVYTGYDFQSGQWQWSWLAEGWTPYLASVLATKGIQKISGILRRL